MLATLTLAEPTSVVPFDAPPDHSGQQLLLFIPSGGSGINARIRSQPGISRQPLDGDDDALGRQAAGLQFVSICADSPLKLALYGRLQWEADVGETGLQLAADLCGAVVVTHAPNVSLSPSIR